MHIWSGLKLSLFNIARLRGYFSKNGIAIIHAAEQKHLILQTYYLFKLCFMYFVSDFCCQRFLIIKRPQMEIIIGNHCSETWFLNISTSF